MTSEVSDDYELLRRLGRTFDIPTVMDNGVERFKANKIIAALDADRNYFAIQRAKGKIPFSDWIHFEMLSGYSVGGLAELVSGKWDQVEELLAERSPPELPPVSPEDLVEGEWYVVRDSSGEEHVVYCVIDPDEGPGLYALDVCFEAGWNLKNVPIYGPLKFKIGGAE